MCSRENYNSTPKLPQSHTVNALIISRISSSLELHPMSSECLKQIERSKVEDSKCVASSTTCKSWKVKSMSPQNANAILRRDSRQAVGWRSGAFIDSRWRMFRCFSSSQKAVRQYKAWPASFSNSGFPTRKLKSAEHVENASYERFLKVFKSERPKVERSKICRPKFPEFSTPIRRMSP